MGTKEAALLSAAKTSRTFRIFHPVATIKCDGAPVYRSQAARDAACLFDVDEAVTSWRCMPCTLTVGEDAHVPDFLLIDHDGHETLVDATDREHVDVQSLDSVAQKDGLGYRLLAREDVYAGVRLRNAKDLLRYGAWTVPLGDRIRLLAALEQEGAMPLQEALKAFSETRPVAGIAALFLQGFLEIDLDDGPIGPDTLVRRIRR